jgi:hypothetical protein
MDMCTHYDIFLQKSSIFDKVEKIRKIYFPVNLLIFLLYSIDNSLLF